MRSGLNGVPRGKCEALPDVRGLNRVGNGALLGFNPPLAFVDVFKVTGAAEPPAVACHFLQASWESLPFPLPS